MAYIISYTQSDYNGNSTSGTFNNKDTTYKSYTFSSFNCNTLVPFAETTYGTKYSSTAKYYTAFVFSSSSYNESGGVFFNNDNNLTISVGLEDTYTGAPYMVTTTLTSSRISYSTSIDGPMVTYTSPTGREYALPTANVSEIYSSITYKNLYLIASENFIVTILNNISTSVSTYSRANETNTTSATSTVIVNASMPAATRISITTCSNVSSSYSMTFNLSSVSVKSSSSHGATGWKAIDGTVTFRYTSTSTISRTSLVIDPNLSQLSSVVGIYQYDVMTSISEVLGTGTLANVITDSTYTAFTSSIWNGITGSVADYDCKVTYFVSTDLKVNTDSFNSYLVSTISTHTAWVEYNTSRYSLRGVSSYINTSVYTQSVIDSISVTRSSMTSEAIQDYTTKSYSKETVSTSSTSLDYDTYYYYRMSSTLNIYISNDDYSATTYYSSSSSAAIKHIKETTSTSSCNITSYTNTDNRGYAYFTTFYGLLVTGTVSATSWVNSAVVISDVSDYVDNLTKYTVGYTDKTFGNIFSSTTIHEDSTLRSIVYTTSEVTRTVSELSIRSSTLSSANAPYEYFTTNYTTWSYATYYYTYMGPDTIGAIVGQTSYNFNESVTRIASNSWYDYISEQQITSSTFNTVDYGTTYRLSELISSSSWFNLGNVNGTVNYRFSYDVNSMFSYNTVIATLSNYTTALATAYTVAYSTATEALSYSFTATQSNTVKTTGERFIDKVEISRTLTIGSYGRNTIAIYNGSTVNTVSSSITGSSVTTSQDVSTVDRTFITSTADFTTETELVSQTTESTVSNRFINSASFIMSTTYEQQNDTLMFKTSWNVYSSYYNTSYYSTIDTIQLTISASTYESLYVPASFTTTSGYTSRSSTTGSYSSSTLVTSVSSYTTTWMPVYTTVDGVYVTTE